MVIAKDDAQITDKIEPIMLQEINFNLNATIIIFAI